MLDMSHNHVTLVFTGEKVEKILWDLFVFNFGVFLEVEKLFIRSYNVYLWSKQVKSFSTLT